MKRRFVVKLVLVEEITSLEESRIIHSQEISAHVIDGDSETIEDGVRMFHITISDCGLNKN